MASSRPFPRQKYAPSKSILNGDSGTPYYSVTTFKNNVTTGVPYNCQVSSFKNYGSVQTDARKNRRPKSYSEGKTNLKLSRYHNDRDKLTSNEEELIETDNESVFKDPNSINISDPYTSVTSFKCYTKSKSVDSSSSTHVTQNGSLDHNSPPYSTADFNGAPYSTNPNYIDNTVVSAYDSTKPPLPTHRPRLAKQQNSQFSTTIDSGLSLKTHGFEPGHKTLKFSAKKSRTQSLDSQVDGEVLVVEDFYEESSDTLKRHSDPFSQTVDLSVSNINVDESSDLLRHTIGHVRLSESPDSGKDSPNHNFGRPFSAGCRRRLPKVPNRNLFGKTGSLKTENLNLDSSEDVLNKKVELTAPTKFKKKVIEKPDDSEDFGKQIGELIENVNPSRAATGAACDASEQTIVVEGKKTKSQTASIQDIKSDLTANPEQSEMAKTSLDIDEDPLVVPVDVISKLEDGDIDDQSDSRPGNSQCSSYLKDANYKLKTKVVSKMASLELDESISVNVEVDVHAGATGNNSVISGNHLPNVECSEQNLNEETSVSEKREINCVEAPLHSSCSSTSKVETAGEGLPAHAFFSFDSSTIQELTDSIMDKENLGNTGKFEISFDSECLGNTGKFEVNLDSESVVGIDIGDEELQILNDMDEDIERAAEGWSKNEVDSDIADCKGRTQENGQSIKGNEDIDSKGDTSAKGKEMSEKVLVEGKSFNGRDCKAETQKQVREVTEGRLKSINSVIAQDNDSSEGDKENREKQIIPAKAKVERTPSYRRRVMARVKTRCGKKSSMHKECSCARNEKGDICVCQFCENYEIKKRSKSSLGIGSSRVLYDNSDSECSEMSSYSEISSPRRALTPNGLPPLPLSNSPRPVRKVQVSSRVDVLMRTELFRKHLYNHETLLQKHTMFRRTGIRKSVSNLDLTAGFVVDSDSDSVYSGKNVETNDNNKDSSCDIDSSNQATEKSRRRSITGDSDSSIENYQKIVNKKKPFSTLPKSHGRSRPAIPSFSDTVSLRNSVPRSQHIPSFHEFKKHKEHNTSITVEDRKLENMDTSQNDNDKIQVRRQEGSGDSLSSTDNSKRKARVRNAVSESETGIPLQLQVIKESGGSQEHLLNVEGNNLETDLRTERKENGTTQSSQKDKPITATDKELKDAKTENCASVTKVRTRVKNKSEALVSAVNYSKEKMIRPNSAPSEKLKQRVKPKVKSRTLSRLEVETETQALSDSNERTQTQLSVRERRKPGSKRPRSLISKKTSLASLIQESENCESNSDMDSSSKSDIKDRPKLKVNYNITRSKSDSKYVENSKDTSEHAPDIIVSRTSHDSFAEKGKNSVSFDLEDVSGCSPFDIGESETSTSLAGSLSDSIRSEVNAEDNSEPLHDLDGVIKPSDDPDQTETEAENINTDEQMSPVLRSTSDACKITQEAARKKRERKERPYKSDPFSGTEIIPASKRCALREERAKLRQRLINSSASSSKEEILTFLDGVSQGELLPCDSFPSLEELNEDEEQIQASAEDLTESLRKVRKNLSNVSSLSTDSGVIGQDGSHDSPHSSPSNTLSHSHSEKNMPPWKTGAGRRSISASCGDLTKAEVDECLDCRPSDRNHNNVMPPQYLICPQCHHRRVQRKETIQEIVDTEINYGRDLNLLKEEFYKPMLKTGLLNKEQLDAIFLNLDELLHVNKYFITKLKSAINSANQNNDTDLQEVMIGCLFLESSTMFLTFENYCVNQAQAPILLEQFEREKELLRIFLQASQNDNQQLRKLHLKSFLMVPVQRIMKYPLLLDRLYKTTPDLHLDKDSLRVAKEKIEDILGCINAKSKSASIHQRKPSNRKVSCSVTEKMEVSRVALSTLHWNRKDVCDVITSQLHVSQPIDHMWAVKKCKNYKFTPVYGVLMTLSQTMNENNLDANDNESFQSNGNENNNPRVQSAAVVFIKEKNGRFQALREPFMLEKCIVSQDSEFTDVFEILEWNKEAYLIKADSPQETKLWVQNLRQQMKNLGCWRKRRNALPNILLNHF